MRTSRLSIREWLSSRDPTSVDLEVVKRRVDFIKSEASFLEEYVLSKSPSEVEGSPVLRRLLERGYHPIVEALLDVCRRIAPPMVGGPCFTAREAR